MCIYLCRNWQLCTVKFIGPAAQWVARHPRINRPSTIPDQIGLEVICCSCELWLCDLSMLNWSHIFRRSLHFDICSWIMVWNFPLGWQDNKNVASMFIKFVNVEDGAVCTCHMLFSICLDSQIPPNCLNIVLAEKVACKQSLHFLCYRYNRLSGLPKSLANCVNLDEFSVEGNNISQLPVRILIVISA